VKAKDKGKVDEEDDVNKKCIQLQVGFLPSLSLLQIAFHRVIAITSTSGKLLFRKQNKKLLISKWSTMKKHNGLAEEI